MAVAGSGGWIPSALFVYRNGKIKQIGLAHNTPKIFVSKPEAAARIMFSGKPARIDVRAGTSLKQVKILLSEKRQELIRIADRPICP
jgi:hypothetical protein